MQKTAAGEDTVLIQNKGYKHEAAYFAKLQSEYMAPTVLRKNTAATLANAANKYLV